MVIDSSALLAFLLVEPEALEFLQLVKKASVRRISAACFLETGMVLGRDASGARQQIFEELIGAWRLVIEPVIERQARIALEAFLTYGKGRHSAAMNFGDCLVYALARDFNEPLLFKGNDFAQTDVRPATE